MVGILVIRPVESAKIEGIGGGAAEEVVGEFEADMRPAFAEGEDSVAPGDIFGPDIFMEPGVLLPPTSSYVRFIRVVLNLQDAGKYASSGCKWRYWR